MCPNAVRGGLRNPASGRAHCKGRSRNRLPHHEDRTRASRQPRSRNVSSRRFFRRWHARRGVRLRSARGVAAHARGHRGAQGTDARSDRRDLERLRRLVHCARLRCPARRRAATRLRRDSPKCSSSRCCCGTRRNCRRTGRGSFPFGTDRTLRTLSRPGADRLPDRMAPGARGRIVADSRSVLQIAGEVGYDSEAAFDRAFKRRFAAQPARCRRSWRESARAEVADPGFAARLQLLLMSDRRSVNQNQYIQLAFANEAVRRVDMSHRCMISVVRVTRS